VPYTLSGRLAFSVGIIVVEERAETPLLREALKWLGKKWRREVTLHKKMDCAIILSG